MKGLGRIGIFTVGLLLCTACAWMRPPTDGSVSTPAAAPMVTWQQAFPPFNVLEVDGPIQVNLEGAQGPQQMWVVGGAGAHDEISAQVKGHTLRIAPRAFSPISRAGHAMIVVRVAHLEILRTTGSAEVIGRGVHSGDLRVEARDSSRVQLYGDMGVRGVSATQSSQVNLRWVNSPALTVEGRDAAEIQLAGIAKQLTVRLSRQARLDARFLRTASVWVRTEDRARADVMPLARLHAFAEGSSHIYYYKTPQGLQKVTRASGNVLLLSTPGAANTLQ